MFTYLLHCESEKRASVLLSITLANVKPIVKFFTVEFGNKFATSIYHIAVIFGHENEAFLPISYLWTLASK